MLCWHHIQLQVLPEDLNRFVDERISMSARAVSLAT